MRKKAIAKYNKVINAGKGFRQRVFIASNRIGKNRIMWKMVNE